jgi:endonuclease/exonuclease/phosphatase family metal-dependent hydrolase
VLLGDMNAWRQCKATRALEDELESHHNTNWPPSFPSARPVLALDRIYASGAKLLEISAHETVASRRASDHLPVIARIELPALR